MNKNRGAEIVKTNIVKTNIVKTSRKSKITRGQVTLLMMTIPSIVFIALFAYLPMSGWIYSFFDYRIGYNLFQCDFVGLDNFIYAFGDPYVLKVIWNTLAISFMGILNIPVACAIAILLSEVRGKWFKKSVQTAITLPNFISWVIIYSIGYAIFSTDGLLNSMIGNLFGYDTTFSLLSNAKTSQIFMAGLYIWKSAGYSSIIFFAAITSIDSELYDAADVDGAGRWSKIKYITLPSLIPTLLTLAIIQIGFLLNSGFDQYYVFMNPIVQKNIEVLDYYVYRLGMLENDIPVSTAVSMCKTFVSIILVFSVNKLAKKTTGQSAM